MKSTFSHLLILIIALTALAPSAHAADEVEMPLFGITPYVGQALWSEEIGLDDSVIYGARAAVMVAPWLGFEGTYGRTETETEYAPNYDTDAEHFGLDLVVDLAPGKRLNPYLTGGWSQFDIDSSGNSISGTGHSVNGWEYGGGVKYRLHETTGRRTDVRIDVRNAMNDLNASFGNDGDWTNNLLVTAGVQFTFGRVARDTDDDGVLDRSDLCPGTPAGAVVDENGCPLDADDDGVIDLTDKCPGTPAGAPVDAEGCPLDTDGDGIIDLYDTCAGTPEGAKTDEKGCPVDSDGDGVYDGLDKCPETPGHLKVDLDGCPIELSETETQLLDTGMIRTSSIRFASGTSDLSDASHAVLDEIAETLRHWPELSIEIGGHTDSQGAAAFNQTLSEQRAQAVLDDLLKRYGDLDAAQYSVKGYGEDAPIADNATRDGRAENRRVEFKVLNTEEIKRVITKQKLMEK